MRIAALGAACVVALGVCRADDTAKSPKEASKAKSPMDRIKELEQEQEKAQTAFFEKYRKLKTDNERAELVRSEYPNPAKYAAKFVEIAKEDPAGEAGAAAYTWILRNDRGGKNFDHACEKLSEHHIDNPKLATTLGMLAYSSSTAGEKLLRAATEKAQKKATRGQATLTLAEMLDNRADRAEAMAKQNPLAKAAAALAGESVEKLDPKRLRQESESLYEKVVKEYGDVEDRWAGSLGERAKSALFEIRNLTIGKTAPEIVGEDIDGKPMKLSEYRGKVVVLDFWGHW